jgi:hypothetical protein
LVLDFVSLYALYFGARLCIPLYSIPFGARLCIPLCFVLWC